MHKLLTKLLLCAALVTTANAVFALEYRSANKHGAIMYSAPNDAAKKVYVVSRGTPFEVLTEQKDWVRVRDQAGALAWMQKQDLAKPNQLQVTRASTVYREANKQSAVVFTAESGLLLEMLNNTKTGWLQVKHRDGLTGFIRIEDVWGL